MCGISRISLSSEIKFTSTAQNLKHCSLDAMREWWLEDRQLWLSYILLAIVDLRAERNQLMVDTSTGNVIVFTSKIVDNWKKESFALPMIIG